MNARQKAKKMKSKMAVLESENRYVWSRFEKGEHR